MLRSAESPFAWPMHHEREDHMARAWMVDQSRHRSTSWPARYTSCSTVHGPRSAIRDLRRAMQDEREDHRPHVGANQSHHCSASTTSSQPRAAQHARMPLTRTPRLMWHREDHNPVCGQHLEECLDGWDQEQRSSSSISTGLHRSLVLDRRTVDGAYEAGELSAGPITQPRRSGHGPSHRPVPRRNEDDRLA